MERDIPPVVPCYPHSTPLSCTSRVHRRHRRYTVYPQCTSRVAEKEPWALTFRFTLGGGTWRPPASSCLFSSVSQDPASFPSLPRRLTQRSDDRRATHGLVA